MDLHESHSKLQKSLIEAIGLFNLAFQDIALVQTPTIKLSNSEYSDDVIISQYMMKPCQNDCIKKISGLLSTANLSASETSYLIKSNFTQDINDRLDYLERLVNEKESIERRDEKKIRVLQDYLVNEINRNQDLERKISDLEAKLVIVEDDKRKYMRKVSSLTGMNADRAIAVDELLGKYVMKKFEDDRFFGLIIGFKYPFFQIIYEDDDKEEMDQYEVEQCLWNGSIPSIKISRIDQYAREYARQHNTDLSFLNKGLNSLKRIDIESSEIADLESPNKKLKLSSPEIDLVSEILSETSSKRVNATDFTTDTSSESLSTGLSANEI